jgi:threonine dehydratase
VSQPPLNSTPGSSPRELAEVLPPDTAAIESARSRIAGQVWRTPLERSAWLSERCGVEVHLKLECWQTTGSFKLRGALNAVASMTAEERDRGIVTASAGNHGQAVAFAARRYGARATVFVPRTAPDAKKSRIRSFGAVLDESAPDYDDAEDAAMAHAARIGATFVHGFSDDAVVAGQGTVGLEILEDLPTVRSIVVPVGGGGLIAGIATVLRREGVQVVGAQSERTPNMHAALAAGRLVDCPIVPTLADGLAGRTDERGLARCRRLVDAVHLVAESSIGPAIRELFVRHGVVAEGAGAVGVAALLEGVIEPAGPTVVVISGRNLDAGRLAQLLRQG